MPEDTASGNSVKKHSILAIGAIPSTFTSEEFWMLRDPRVLQWSRNDVRDNNPIPASVEHILPLNPEVARHKMPILKKQIEAAPQRPKVYETFNPEAFKQQLKSLLHMKPPVNSPEGNGNGGGHNSGQEEQKADANPKPPDPPAGNPPPPADPPANPGAKLPPPGEQWKLPEFIRANANIQAPHITEEARRVHKLCLKNGYPDAKQANVEQHIRKMRQKAAGADSQAALNKVLAAVDNPAVTEFLNVVNLLASQAPLAAKAIDEERAGYKARIAQLEDDNAQLKEDNAALQKKLEEWTTQAAKLLQGLVKG